MISNHPLLLPSLRNFTIQEFTPHVARIRAPLLQSLEFGTHFGARGRNHGWNDTAFGPAYLDRDIRRQMAELLLDFLTLHAATLESVKIHSSLIGSVTRGPDRTTFPQLRHLLITPRYRYTESIDAPNLDVLEIADQPELLDSYEFDSLDGGLTNTKSLTIPLLCAVELPKAILQWPRCECLNIVIFASDLVDKLYDVTEYLYRLAQERRIWPSTNRLVFTFEGTRPLVGVRNWGTCLIKDYSEPERPANFYVETDSDDTTSYAPSSMYSLSDVAEYVDDSDEWDEESNEDGSDGMVDDNPQSGEDEPLEASKTLNEKTTYIHEYVQRLSACGDAADTPEAQFYTYLFHHPDIAFHWNHNVYPSDFNGAYCVFLQLLSWVVSRWRETDGRGVPKRVVIAHGERCEVDLTIPDAFNDAVVLSDS